MFKIEKNVPTPKSRTNNKYPFADMQPGDSFFVAGMDHRKLLSAAYTHGKRRSKKFVTRPENGGARCWRVE